MEFFIPPWFVSLAVLFLNVQSSPLTRGQSAEVTYAELVDLGVGCYPSDSCQKNDTTSSYRSSCDCDSSCSVYGTCCVDSEFRAHNKFSKTESNLKCLSVYNNPGFKIYMVDSCKNKENFDHFCFNDPEENNDPFLLVPVTSEVTGITYKNYFCAICNEEVDSNQLEFWDFKFLGDGTLVRSLSEPQFKFNKMINSWTLIGRETSIVPITLKIQKNAKTTVKYCLPDLIESCARYWTDETVALKCSQYMAIVTASQNKYINPHYMAIVTASQNKYRNPHCALCNFESLSNLQCGYFDLGAAPVVSAFAPPGAGLHIPLLSLFVLEDRLTRCGENMIYDKFADRCRCNSRIYKKENGNCVRI